MVSAIVDYGVSGEYMDFIDLHGYAAWLLIIYIVHFGGGSSAPDSDVATARE